ncbi:hypothetical protein D3C72_2497380 [compost metagenome]
MVRLASAVVPPTVPVNCVAPLLLMTRAWAPSTVPANRTDPPFTVVAPASVAAPLAVKAPLPVG